MDLSESLPVFQAYILERLQKLWVASHFDPEFLHALAATLTRLWGDSSSSREAEDSFSLLDLPVHCGAAVDGKGLSAQPAAAAWALLYAAVHLLDDIEDHELANDFFSLSNDDCVLNLATSLTVIAEQVLNELEADGLDGQAANDLRWSFNRGLLRMAAGQHHDLCTAEAGLPRGWEIAAAKSGEFFALACYAGARSVTSDGRILQGFKDYGFHLGMLVQAANDVAGLWGKSEVKSDLAKGKRTLPVAYALEVLPAGEAARLRRLLGEAGSSREVESQARSLLRGCGAVVYMLLEAEKHALLAQHALHGLPLQQGEKGYLLRIPESIVKSGEEVRDVPPS